MTYRHDRFANGTLIERVEIERVDEVTVVFRRYDGSLVEQENRPATADEIVRVDEHEAAEVQEVKRQNVKNAVATLRSWAEDARNTTVTGANNDAVTQQVVDRLGTFFDRFADLVETRM